MSLTMQSQPSQVVVAVGLCLAAMACGPTVEDSAVSEPGTGGKDTAPSMPTESDGSSTAAQACEAPFSVGCSDPTMCTLHFFKEVRSGPGGFCLLEEDVPVCRGARRCAARFVNHRHLESGVCLQFTADCDVNPLVWGNDAECPYDSVGHFCE